MEAGRIKKVLINTIQAIEKEDLKILSSEMDSILVNAKSILNAVETIRKLQTKKLKELTPEELLVALTTWKEVRILCYLKKH